MKGLIEKILERLDAKKQYFQKFYEADGKTEEDECINKATQLAFDDAKNIVQEVAEEYNGGWIPCSDNSAKLPKENEKVRVTVWTGIEKIGFMQYGKWFVYSSEGVAEATVVAWQPTEPYKERD